MVEDRIAACCMSGLYSWTFSCSCDGHQLVSRLYISGVNNLALVVGWPVDGLLWLTESWLAVHIGENMIVHQRKRGKVQNYWKASTKYEDLQNITVNRYKIVLAKNICVTEICSSNSVIIKCTVSVLNLARMWSVHNKYKIEIR